jgi:hypothetical protein
VATHSFSIPEALEPRLGQGESGASVKGPGCGLGGFENHRGRGPVQRTSWFRGFLGFVANGFAVTFPLETVGILVEGYPVTLPMVLVAILALAVLITGGLGAPLRRARLVSGLAFLWWGLVTLMDGAVLKDAASLVLCGTLMLPLMAGPWLREAAAYAGRWFVRGALGTVLISAYQIGGYLLNLPGIRDFLPLGSLIREEVIGRFPRASATFFEPAYYAIYLVFAIGCLDLVAQGYYSRWRYTAYRLCLLGALIATLSLAGAVLALVYHATRAVPVLGRVMSRGRIRLVRASLVFATAAVVWLGLLLSGGVVADSRKYVSFKLSQIIEQYQGRGSLQTSVGVRLGVTGVVGGFWKFYGPRAVAMGTGFNRIEEGLVNCYGWAEGSPLARGTVPNVYAAVVLGTGLTGLIFYAVWLLSLAPDRVADGKADWKARAYFLTWLVAHAATGQLIVYPLYGYAYLMLWSQARPGTS